MLDIIENILKYKTTPLSLMLDSDRKEKRYTGGH